MVRIAVAAAAAVFIALAGGAVSPVAAQTCEATAFSCTEMFQRCAQLHHGQAQLKHGVAQNRYGTITKPPIRKNSRMPVANGRCFSMNRRMFSP
jgi:hypothetical protein